MSSPKKSKPYYDKNAVAKLLEEKSDKIKYVPACLKDIHKDFKRFVIDGTETDYITCSSCEEILIIKHIKGAGTGNLLRHLRLKHKSGSISVKKLVQPKVIQWTNKPAVPADKMIVADKAAICCAVDFRPFNMVEGDGFVEFIQSVIDVAAIKGRVLAADLLPTADTVTNHLMQIDQSLRARLKLELEEIDHVNCTTDHWSDKYSGQKYQSITIHYFDPTTEELRSRVIGTVPVDDSTSETTFDHFKSQLQSFELESKLKIVVTDNAASMKSAFYDVNWVSCAAHNLSLAHQNAYSITNDRSNPTPTITTIIQSAKSIVEYMKRSGNNKFLDHRLKQVIETRWDSHADMLMSVLENFEVLQLIPPVLGDLENINEGILKELSSLLEVLKILRMELCSEKIVTFNLVAITYDKILKLLTKKKSDSQPIMALKTNFTKSIKDKFTVTKFHLIATFLTPKFRSFRFPNEKLLDQAMQELKFQVEVIDESDNESLTDQNDPENQEVNQSLFADYYEKSFVPSGIQSEIEGYKAHSLSKSDINMCPLKFWSTESIQEKFPNVSKIAMWLLAAPATNVASERSFSAVGNIITPHRNLISPEIVDMSVFTKFNRDLI